MTNWVSRLAPWNPLRAVWRLLTNVRWAIALIAFLALTSLLGVLLPQIPDGVRGDSPAVSVWLDAQRGKYGILTDVIHGYLRRCIPTGLFEQLNQKLLAAFIEFADRHNNPFIRKGLAR